MTHERGAEIVAGLGEIVKVIASGTKAPVVIVLVMGGSEAGSILSSCYGPKNASELAAALRRAADFTDNPERVEMYPDRPRNPQ